MTTAALFYIPAYFERNKKLQSATSKLFFLSTLDVCPSPPLPSSLSLPFLCGI